MKLESIDDLLMGFLIDPPSETASVWCESNLMFNEPGNVGPYSLAGREYAREPLDCFSDPLVTDIVLVFGSQGGKTGILMGGAAYRLKNHPSRMGWAFPNTDLSRAFSETRWIPMLRASPIFLGLIPEGAHRHAFKKGQQSVGQGMVNFMGSNSAANLSSNPMQVTIADEVDKFNEGGIKEADALNLLEQRTKDASSPKRAKASTPTVTSGPIWQELLKSDFRRRFAPCPFCAKLVVFSFSKDYTVIDPTGCEAFLTWDKEARKPSGGWDLDRVFRSARYQCPHCGGHIHDGHKTAMDRNGVWKPTKDARSTIRGYHLPSFYAPSAQTTAGKIAVKFLEAKASLKGVRGIVNSDFAEPWENQDERFTRHEIIVPSDSAKTEGSVGIMTVDYQKLSPDFWVVIRDWWPNGVSQFRGYWPLFSWDDLIDLQEEQKIENHMVFIDRNHEPEEVYRRCLKRGKLAHRPNMPPLFVGWVPVNGLDKRAVFKDQKTKQELIWRVKDIGGVRRGFEFPMLQFNGPAMKDILAMLRGPEPPFRWLLTEKVDEVYRKHMASNFRKTETNRLGGVTSDWVKRSNWPDHIYDCETEQIAAALLKRKLPWLDLSKMITKDENAGVRKTTP